MVKHITIHITKTCNLNCEFCHVAARCGEKDTNKIDMRILRNLFAPTVESISIAGGEPFFVKDKLYDLLNQIPENVKSVGITTNGLLLEDEDIQILKKKNMRLQFSMDGTPPDHEANRGKNTFSKSLENMKKAIAAGIRTDVLTTVSKDNMHHMDEYIKSVDDLGIENIMLLHFTPKGRGAYMPELEVPQLEWMRFCMEFGKNCGAKKTRVWIQPRFMMKSSVQRMDKARMVQLCNCHRFEYAYVDIDDGMVYPCGLAYNTPLGIGSLKDETLQELVQCALAKDQVPKECKNCESVEVCQGGAKCYAWLVKKDICAKDPYCSGGNIIPICPFPAEYIAGPKMRTKIPTIV